MAGRVDACLSGVDENCVLGNFDCRGRRCRPMEANGFLYRGLGLWRFPNSCFAAFPIRSVLTQAAGDGGRYNSKFNDLRGMDVLAGANFFEQLRVRRGVEI